MAESEWDRVTRERQADAVRAGARRLAAEAASARAALDQVFLFDGLAGDCARTVRSLERRARRAERAARSRPS